MPAGPRFLDDGDNLLPPIQPSPPQPSPSEQAGAQVAAEPALPKGPLLLDAAPDSGGRLDLGWMPEAIAPPPVRFGTASWLVAGLITLVLGWAALALLSFIVSLFGQHLALGLAGVVALGSGLAMMAIAAVREIRAYRSLGQVERLRAVLNGSQATLELARTHALAWLATVAPAVGDAAGVTHMLQEARTIAEIRGILRSRVSDPLRAQAGRLGRRAAVEGATLVAICPHPAWDGVIAGARGLLVIRRVAALYGLRPGLAVTLALTRRVAVTAAGTAGLTLVSQGLADHALTGVPVLKHIGAALPGSGVVGFRLYRLANVTAEACCPAGA